MIARKRPDKATKAWTRSAADEHAAHNGCYFDERSAVRVREFFTRWLKHSKGQFAGKPFELLDWQWSGVVAPLFGWKRPDGTRRFRQGGIWIPKKNGKSTLCAGIQLYMLLADSETGAEIYVAAADRDQASIVYNESANMVEASKTLSGKLQCIRSTKRIIYVEKAAFIRALSSEVKTKEGINAHCIIFDELHAQQTRDLWDTLTYAGAARRQPLLLSISTAGYDKHSIGWEQYQYAKAVSDHANDFYDDEFFAYIAEAPAESDWTDQATWTAANPSMGITIQMDEMSARCREAQQTPAKENAFRRYRLNQWTEQDTRWISLDKWDACAGGRTDAELVGEPCFCGLDLANTIDIAAFVAVFPQDDGTIDVRAKFWIPAESAAERSRKDRVPYGEWLKAGIVSGTPGNGIDYGQIRADINAFGDAHRVMSIGCDRWNATHLIQDLTADGFEIVAFGQGYRDMTSPTKELERLILEKQLKHNGNAVLRWMAGNVTVEQDAAGNLKPSKGKSREKIDGIVALVMAIGRATVHQEVASYYESNALEIG